MVTYKLKWHRATGAVSYDIYKCDTPGGEYVFLANVPQMDTPEYEIQVDMIPRNLSFENAYDGLTISWQEPYLIGVPITFKVFPKY